MRRTLKSYSLLDEIVELGFKQAIKEWLIGFLYSLTVLTLILAAGGYIF